VFSEALGIAKNASALSTLKAGVADGGAAWFGKYRAAARCAQDFGQWHHSRRERPRGCTWCRRAPPGPVFRAAGNQKSVGRPPAGQTGLGHGGRWGDPSVARLQALPTPLAGTKASTICRPLNYAGGDGGPVYLTRRPRAWRAVGDPSVAALQGLHALHAKQGRRPDCKRCKPATLIQEETRWLYDVGQSQFS
jgi:hypothetical protein